MELSQNDNLDLCPPYLNSTGASSPWKCRQPPMLMKATVPSPHLPPAARKDFMYGQDAGAFLQ